MGLPVVCSPQQAEGPGKALPHLTTDTCGLGQEAGGPGARHRMLTVMGAELGKVPDGRKQKCVLTEHLLNTRYISER